MSYADLVDADRRLLILRLLADDADYAHNEAVINAACGRLGHRVSRTKTRADLAHLVEVGAVTTEQVGDAACGFLVAKLTGLGLDAAVGTVTLPGVERPRPA